jgi:hypothetical protein
MRTGALASFSSQISRRMNMESVASWGHLCYGRTNIDASSHIFAHYFTLHWTSCREYGHCNGIFADSV